MWEPQPAGILTACTVIASLYCLLCPFRIVSKVLACGYEKYCCHCDLVGVVIAERNWLVLFVIVAT
jgi:hypothetical protein